MTPHQDNESVLVASSSVATLSLGATRRFNISPSDDKNNPMKTINLLNNSFLVMLPGFQTKYCHSVSAGRRSIRKERGERYSVPFRQINIPSPSGITEYIPKPPEQNSTPSPTLPRTNAAAPDTVVFGSSLVKHLDEGLLSKYEKTFKVYSHPGAHIRGIHKDLVKVAEGNKLNSDNVTTVFVLCGGNDLEDLSNDADISLTYEDYANLINCAKKYFPNAIINVISTIPRRTRYNTHIRNMHTFNIWLEKHCNKINVRYVNIYSFYVNKRTGGLHKKLFNNDLLHFNVRGYSVLGKVLLGVANRPWD